MAKNGKGMFGKGPLEAFGISKKRGNKEIVVSEEDQRKQNETLKERIRRQNESMGVPGEVDLEKLAANLKAKTERIVAEHKQKLRERGHLGGKLPTAEPPRGEAAVETPKAAPEAAPSPVQPPQSEVARSIEAHPNEAPEDETPSDLDYLRAEVERLEHDTSLPPERRAKLAEEILDAIGDGQVNFYQTAREASGSGTKINPKDPKWRGLYADFNDLKKLDARVRRASEPHNQNAAATTQERGERAFVPPSEKTRRELEQDLIHAVLQTHRQDLTVEDPNGKREHGFKFLQLYKEGGKDMIALGRELKRGRVEVNHMDFDTFLRLNPIGGGPVSPDNAERHSAAAVTQEMPGLKQIIAEHEIKKQAESITAQKPAELYIETPDGTKEGGFTFSKIHQEKGKWVVTLGKKDPKKGTVIRTVDAETFVRLNSAEAQPHTPPTPATEPAGEPALTISHPSGEQLAQAPVFPGEQIDPIALAREAAAAETSPILASTEDGFSEKEPELGMLGRPVQLETTDEKIIQLKSEVEWKMFDVLTSFKAYENAANGIKGKDPEKSPHFARFQKQQVELQTLMEKNVAPRIERRVSAMLLDPKYAGLSKEQLQTERDVLTAKMQEKYRGIVIFNAVGRYHQERQELQLKALSEKKQNLFAKTLQKVGAGNKWLESKLGKNGARAARILGFAGISAAIGAFSPAAAMGFSGYLGLNLLRRVGGLVVGTAAGSGAGYLFGKTVGTRFAEKRAQSRRHQISSVEDLQALEKVQKKTSKEAIARKTKLTESLTAALVAGGLSYEIAHQLLSFPSVTHTVAAETEAEKIWNGKIPASEIPVHPETPSVAETAAPATVMPSSETPPAEASPVETAPPAEGIPVQASEVNPSLPSVEATIGQGYTHMLKDLWEQRDQIDRTQFPEGSPMRRLLEAGEKSFMRTALDIAEKDQFFSKTGGTVHRVFQDSRLVVHSDGTFDLIKHDPTVTPHYAPGHHAPIEKAPPPAETVPAEPEQAQPETEWHITHPDSPEEMPAVDTSQALEQHEAPDTPAAEASVTETPPGEPAPTETAPAATEVFTNRYGVPVQVSEAHIYSDEAAKTKHLYLFGGTPEEKMAALSEFFANPENAGATVYGPDLKGLSLGGYVLGPDGKPRFAGLVYEKTFWGGTRLKAPPGLEEFKKLIK